MLRKFNISIDGKEYLVEMEEIGGVDNKPIQQADTSVPVVEKIETIVETPIPIPVGNSKASNDAMVSPMPGTILKILVNVGEEVKENQPLLILEAMKMENEVVATNNGTVSGIHVVLGQVVNAGDALITIDE